MRRMLIDGQLDDAFDWRDAPAAWPISRPTSRVVTTAPSYLFWRCAPPELRVPQETVRAICADVGGTMVGVGPHGSTTPKTTLRKLGVDAVVMGECEEILPQLAGPWGRRIHLLPGERRALGAGRHPCVRYGGAARRSAGPTRTVRKHMPIITTGSKRTPQGPERKWRRRADARITARFALRTISATNIAAGLCR